jgi:hypothetical protein
MTRTIDELPGPRAAALKLRPDRARLVLEQWARSHGPVYRFALNRRDVVVFGEREPVDAMLRSDGFRRRPELGFELDSRLAGAALGREHLSRCYGHVRDCVERLDERLMREAFRGDPVDLRAAFEAYGSGVRCRLALGHDLGTLERQSELRQHLERVVPAVARRLAAPLARARVDRRTERSVTALRVIVAGCVGHARTRMELRAELYERPETLLEGMLALKPRDDDVLGAALALLLTAESTTVHALAWSARLLGGDPELQARVADEARAVLGDARVPPDAATAAALPLVRGVLGEALRPRPASPLLVLEPLQDTTLGGVRLPAGTRVVGLAGGALAFGRLAALEAQAALAMLVRNFEVALTGRAGLQVLLRERR